MIDRRTALANIGLAAAAPAFARAAEPDPLPREPSGGGTPQWIDLWPATPPGAPDHLPEERIVDRPGGPVQPDRVMQAIARPRLAVFRPLDPTGAAVLVVPGGGYGHVVIDKEGFEMGLWLAARGIAAFVLFYRLPHQGWASGPDTPLVDAQRAMRVIRSNAPTFAIDPARVSVMGFSAGGHVAATLATRFAASVYASVDAADTIPARPDGAALIYPVIAMNAALAHPGSRERLIGANPPFARELAHSPDGYMPADAPSFFLLHAEDDTVVVAENALLMRAAARRAGIAVETHLFEQGGHGFGISRAAGKPVEAWPETWLAWAQAKGLA